MAHTRNVYHLYFEHADGSVLIALNTWEYPIKAWDEEEARRLAVDLIESCLSEEEALAVQWWVEEAGADECDCAECLMIEK